ncbi:MAG: molybdenum cofactor guanylyltransferase [Thermomicrobiales bacterium]
MQQPITEIEQCSCAVLAGGRSSRLGTDKALLRLDADGPSLIESVLSLAHQLTDDVMVVGREVLDGTSTHVRFLPDPAIDQGPLAGIATALAASQYDRCLVLPCDAPFLSLHVLHWMISLPQTTDALVPSTSARSRQGGRQSLQTLHAIYRRTCLAPIRAALEHGNRHTTAWFESATIQVLPEDTIRQIDPQLMTFFTINTPEDLEYARQHLRSPDGGRGPGQTV